MENNNNIPEIPFKNWRSAWLGLGGNVGDVLANLRGAMTILRDDETVKIIAISSIYQTPPWGIKDQPAFLNICVEILTNVMAEDLLKLCNRAEHELKRERIIKWGPRTIDIDILLLEEGAFKSAALEIPHPRITQRAFVLVPLTEIAGERMLNGRTIDEWRTLCDEEGIKKIGDNNVFDDLLSQASHSDPE